MRSGALLIAIAVTTAWSQQNNPPQRTITSRPDSTSASDAKPAPAGAPANFAAQLEQYKQAWQKMTPAQQKLIVSAGGMTPEQFERMLTGKGPQAKGAIPATDTRGADTGSLDVLSKSLQDLNAVRDGNLLLVQKDGCPPELASRIADLKAKLRSDELDWNGAAVPSAVAPAARQLDNGNGPDAMAIAADWFQRPADSKPTAVSTDANRTRESKLLDAVLSGTPAAPTPERNIDPKSPEAEQHRKVLEADIARVKAELNQLSGACAAGAK
jgi:hypothetical protein